MVSHANLKKYPDALFFVFCAFVVVGLWLCDVAEGVDVRVLVPLWLTDFGSTESYDLEAVQREATGFLLAAKHFNERRVDLYPALSSVTECEKNISIVAICDESANSRRVSSIIQEFNGEFDVVCGLSSVAVEAAATFADVANDAPLITHWAASSVLSNEDRFPLTSRTFITDMLYFSKIAQFVKQMGFTKLCTLYIDEDSVPSANKDFENSLRELDIDLLSFSYAYDDAESIRGALTQIKETGRTLIVFMGWQTDLANYVHKEASALGLNSTEHLWILTTIDYLPDIADIEADESLRKFLAGSLFFDFGASDDSLLQGVYESMSSELDEDVIDKFNQKLPPFGTKDEVAGSCKNDQLDMSLPDDFFSNFLVDNAPVGFATGYDAIMAIGLAMCVDPSSAMPASGEEFTQTLRQLSFQGLSGNIAFDENGDRLESTTVFTMYNWRTSDSGASLQLVRSGEFNGTDWNFEDESEIELRGGHGWAALPGNYISPNHNHNYLPKALIILGYVEVFFGVLLGLVCLAWMYANRSEAVIRASQPVFMTTAVLGCMCVVFAILPLTADDNPDNGLFAEGTVACMAIPYMFFVGSQVVLGAIIGKTIRAYMVFKRTSRYHLRIQEWHVFLFIIILLIPSLVLLIVWEYVAPFSFKRVPMSFDAFGQIVESRGECNFNGDGRAIAFLTVLCVLFTLAMVSLRVLSAYEKKRFVEERNLSAALLQSFALLVPATLAAYSYVIGRFVILSSFFLLSSTVVLVFLFLPKYLQIREQRRFKRVVDGFETGKNFDHSNNDIDILDAMRIPMVQSKFARYAEENYITESFLFVVDVLAYKDQFASQSNAWRTDKASSIMNVYIRAGSLLQVNISERCREQVATLYKRVQGAKEILTEDLFDAPLREISSMLNHGAWAIFVQDGGMYNVRPSLVPRSKVFSIFSTAEPSETPKSPNASALNSSQEVGHRVVASRQSVL